jgi:hypothetical protein
MIPEGDRRIVGRYADAELRRLLVRCAHRCLAFILGLRLLMTNVRRPRRTT